MKDDAAMHHFRCSGASSVSPAVLCCPHLFFVCLYKYTHTDFFVYVCICVVGVQTLITVYMYIYSCLSCHHLFRSQSEVFRGYLFKVASARSITKPGASLTKAD